MRKAGILALYPGAQHRIHPYLLRDLENDRVNQIWFTDISYIPMRKCFLYLVATMGWLFQKDIKQAPVQLSTCL